MLIKYRKTSAILFLILFPFSVFCTEKIKYFRNSENFNYPLHARFWGELEESQLSQVNGRYFRVTYSNQGSANRALCLKKIEHFYLGQPQGIYAYKNTDFSGQEIQFSNAAIITFKYDRNDKLQEIDFFDKNLKKCRNSYGASRYKYNHRGGYKFTEIRYSLNSNNDYVERKAPHENALEYELRHKSISGMRVWTKIQSLEFQSSIVYTYSGLPNGIKMKKTTTYYHKNSNQRRIDKDGCFKLEEYYEKQHGFLNKRVRYDSEDNIIGIVEISRLVSNSENGYDYTTAYENNRQMPELFYDGESYDQIEYNQLFDTIKTTRNNEISHSYVRKRKDGKVVVTITKTDGKTKDVMWFSNSGLELNKLESNQGIPGKQYEYHYNFFDDEGKIESVEKTIKNKGELIQPNSIEVPKTIFHLNQNGYYISEIRYKDIDSKMSVTDNGSYEYAFVPEIEYEFNDDGALIVKRIKGDDNKYFEVLSGEFLYASDFEDVMYTLGVNAIEYQYSNGSNTSETYYKEFGSITPLRGYDKIKTTIKKTNLNDEELKYVQITTCKNRAMKDKTLDYNGSIIRLEKGFDRYDRLLEERVTYKDRTTRKVTYSYNNKTLPYPLFSKAVYWKNGNAANIEGGNYHSIEYKRDYKGNTLTTKKSNVEGELMPDRRFRGSYWTNREFDHFNRIIEKSFKDKNGNDVPVNISYHEKKAHKVKYEFDNRGNTKKMTTYSPTTINNEIGIKEEEQFINEFDKKDRIIFEARKLEGQFVENSSGTYKQRYRYDGSDNMSFIKNFNKIDKPMKDFEGNYGVQIEYNEISFPISQVYLGRDYDIDDGGDYASRKGTEIRKEVYSYDKNGILNRIAYFKDVVDTLVRAVDENGISIKYIRVNDNNYKNELELYLSSDEKPVKGPDGFSKIEFAFDDNDNQILSKYYVPNNGDHQLQFTGCDESSSKCNFFEKKIFGDDGNETTEFWTENQERIEQRSLSQHGVHKVEKRIESITIKGKAHTRIIYSVYDLKKGKSNKMDITGFQQILKDGERFNEYVEGGRHEIIIDVVGEERYFSLKSKKGKKVLFSDPDKDPYQYMVTDSQLRILRFSQKYNTLKIK